MKAWLATGLALAPVWRSVPVRAEPPAPPALPGSVAPATFRPFDDSIYTLSYEVFLAAGNVPEAYALAQAAVAQRPALWSWRERLARTAEWSGRPKEALEQWERLGAQHPAEESFRQALRLAGLVGDQAARARALDGMARLGALKGPEWMQMAAAYEAAGQPERAVDRLATHIREHADRSLWETQAAILERLGRDDEALAVYQAMAAKFGDDPALALARARNLSRHGRILEAASIMEAAVREGAVRKADSSLAPFWRMSATLSLWRQRYAEALDAYAVLLRGGAYTVEDAHAALETARERDSALALEAATAGWRRFRSPDFLIYYLDRCVERGRWGEAVAALDALSPEDRGRFAGMAYFFDLASRIHQHEGREESAFREYRHAVALDPDAEDLRAGFLWLLMEQGRRADLAAWVGRWESADNLSQTLLLPMAMAYKLLHRNHDALECFRRMDADGSRADFPFLLNYAELLEQEGDGEGALRMYARAARARGAPAAGTRPDSWEWREAEARWAFRFASGDDADRRVQELLAATGGKEGARELAFSWRLSRGESAEEAMTALGAQAAPGKPQAFPAWAELAAAISRSDAASVGDILERKEASLSFADRAVAAAFLGDERKARRLAQESLSDPALRDEGYPLGLDHLLRAGSGTVEAGLRVSSRALFLERRAWAGTYLPLGNRSLLRLSLEDRRRPRISPRMPTAPERETVGELQLGRQGSSTSTEIAVGFRSAGNPDSTLPALPQPAVPALGNTLWTVDASYQWRPHGRAALTLAYARNNGADESPVLELTGVKDEWRVAISLPLPRGAVALEAGAMAFGDRARRLLGRGAEFKAGAQTLLDPVLVALEGGYHGFDPGPSRPGPDGTFLIEGWLPRTDFPQSYWQATGRLEWGLETPAPGSYRPAPFAAAEAGLSRFLPAPEQPGFWEPGYGLRGGLSLCPTRSQRISVSASHARGLRLPSDREFRLETSYEYFLR